MRDVEPADDDLAGVRPVERADEVQKRALAAAGRAGERDELAFVDGRQRDVLERADAAVLEALPDVPNLDVRATHLTTLTGNLPIPLAP